MLEEANVKDGEGEGDVTVVTRAVGNLPTARLAVAALVRDAKTAIQGAELAERGGRKRREKSGGEKIYNNTVSKREATNTPTKPPWLTWVFCSAW